MPSHDGTGDQRRRRTAVGGEAAANPDDYGLSLQSQSDQSERSQSDAPDPDHDDEQAGDVDLSAIHEAVVEPADPPDPDHEARAATRLVPPSMDTGILPTPLQECGCGECPPNADPLADMGDDDTDVDLSALYTHYAADVCEDPRPVTVDRAREIYCAYQRASFAAEERTSGYERDRARYHEILSADRRLQAEYGEALTTMLFSFRLSPIEAGEWVPPVKLATRLMDGREAVMRALRYRLRGYEWEYVAVVAGTDSAATPHYHLYAWVRDPENDVDPTDFEAVRDRHVEAVTGAYEKDHPIDPDGDEGTVRVEHDPIALDLSALYHPERDEDAADEARQQTRGATYVAAQLPHLALGDVEERGREAVADTRLDAAAIKWAATPIRWYAASQGISSAT